MEKRQIILPTLRYEKSIDVDSQIHIGIEEEKSLLRIDDRDIVLNLPKQYEKERKNSIKYKLYGKIKMIFRNLYYGTSPYNYLSQRLALKGNGSDGDFTGYLPYDEFAFIRLDMYREIPFNINVESMNDFKGFTTKTTGTNQHQQVTTLNSSRHNWGLYLSYIHSHDSNYPIKYTLSGITTPLSFVSGDGIPFRVEQTTTEYILTSPVEHGMSQGEYIIIKGIPYYINSVGNEVYNSEKYVINLYKSQLNAVVFSNLVNGKRCTDINDINYSTSEYYIHRHKIISNINDYSFNKVGFESPIWEDEKKTIFENSVGDQNVIVERNRMESFIFDFTKPFILSGITNNLGYTPTELYVSMIFRNGNGFFNYPPKNGYSFHMHDTWVDNHFSGTTSIETGITYNNIVRDGITFKTGNIIENGTFLNGAFIEYHPKEMKERIISQSFHKIDNPITIFNHNQTLQSEYVGASINNTVGLFYQPHYKFKLRELSPYTETSNTNKIDNLPENARYFPNENLWRWRDLYDDGYVDTDGYGTDHPYLNDLHYVHQDINFYLRNEKSYINKKDGLIDFNTEDKVC